MGLNLSKNVTIVTVTYNSMGVLPDMLKSIPPETPIVIVDNASEDILKLKALSKRVNAKLIINTVNKGFGEACNQGAKLAKTDFIFFLNPDASIEKNALEHLVDSAKINTKALAFNPKILKPNGSVYFKRSSHLLDRSSWMGRSAPKKDSRVNILSGAAFLIRRKAFTDLGGWDENIFLYHEEDDLCLRVKDIGGELMFVSRAVVRHIRGSSTPSSKKGAYFKGWHMGKSRVYATVKHKRKYARSLALFGAIIQLTSPVSLVSGRKRAKSWGYLKGVISSLIN